jgi:maleate isomerase
VNNSQRRIGVLLPPGNVAVEREFGVFAPPSVACNYNRMSRPLSKSTKSSLLSMIPSLERAAVDLEHVHPELILFACTSGSFLEGRGKEDEIAHRITRHTRIPAITTSMAVTDALDALGIKRAFMITPYPDDINEEEVEFLEHYGVEVPEYDSFRCDVTELTAAVPSKDVAAMALRHRAAIVKCGALFISCTQLLTMVEIEPLERALGVPVVSSNQATLWAALRFLKLSDPVPAGRLFATLRPEARRPVRA